MEIPEQLWADFSSVRAAFCGPPSGVGRPYSVVKTEKTSNGFEDSVSGGWDQDKSWALHVVYSVCVEELRQWFKVQGFNLKNRKDISYPTIIRSAIRPVLYGPDLPIPSPPDTLDNILDDLDQISHISSDSDDGYDPGTNDPELFSQSDLNDLVRDLGLPKDIGKVLKSRLKGRHLLNSGVSFSWYRFREKEFVSFFTQEGDLVFGNHAPEILEMFKIMYEPEE
ncbi:uncharacterized protein TNCV_3653891 [Trichonephila clavipes]|nr:uncharacterized protein TNCV_3653891 [Trichonephila clavipes]